MKVKIHPIELKEAINKIKGATDDARGVLMNGIHFEYVEGVGLRVIASDTFAMKAKVIHSEVVSDVDAKRFTATKSSALALAKQIKKGDVDVEFCLEDGLVGNYEPLIRSKGTYPQCERIIGTPTNSKGAYVDLVHARMIFDALSQTKDKGMWAFDTKVIICRDSMTMTVEAMSHWSDDTPATSASFKAPILQHPDADKETAEWIAFFANPESMSKALSNSSPGGLWISQSGTSTSIIQAVDDEGYSMRISPSSGRAFRDSCKALPDAIREKYFSLKKNRDDGVLFISDGEYFHTYREDAVAVAKQLGLVVTYKGTDDQCTTIPCHSWERMAKELFEAGFKVYHGSWMHNAAATYQGGANE